MKRHGVKIMRIIRLVALTAVILVFLPVYLNASEPLNILEKGCNGEYIGNHLDFMEDASGKLEIDEIKTGDISQKFKPFKVATNAFGFKAPIHWVRLTVRNPAPETIEWYLENDYCFFDRIDLYEPDGTTGGYIKRSQGNNYDKEFDKNQWIKNNSIIFKISVPEGTHTYYLRFQTAGAMIIALRAWNWENLYRNKDLNHFIMSMYWGIFAVMLLYNFFIFISTREKSYIYYIMQLFCWGCFQFILYGYAQEFLWPGRMQINKSWVIFIAAVSLFTTLFLRSFIETKKLTPRLDEFVIVPVTGLSAVMMVFLSIVPYETAVLYAIIYAQFIIILSMLLATYCIFKRSRAAVFFAIGQFFLTTGGMIEMMKDSAVLPINFFTSWAMIIGPGIGISLFSLGLADKINTMKKALSELNLSLERKVKQRTVDLQTALHELEVLNKGLVSAKDALWGEMEIAKKIQTVLLPKNPSIEGYEIAAYMKPADEVGGDYYDVLNYQGIDWIVIGDVSGHGIPAGLIMMMVQTSIHTVLEGESNVKPSKLLAMVNSVIRENIKKLGEDKYMTITVLAAVKNGKFYFSGLHQDILIFRYEKSDVESITTEGMWLGLCDDIENLLTDNSLNLNINDSMVLYTDGITEALDESSIKNGGRIDDDMYSQERLALVFKENGEKSPEKILQAILGSLKGYRLDDDITIVVMKRVSASGGGKL
jgi:serine phosphatase RsbU (regulator of sigma subunit)